MHIGAIADDITGATDLALMLTREGFRVRQIVGVPEHGTDFSGVEAVVVSLKSRTTAPAAAVSQSLASAFVSALNQAWALNGRAGGQPQMAPDVGDGGVFRASRGAGAVCRARHLVSSHGDTTSRMGPIEVAALIVALLLTLAIAYVLTRTITRPINALMTSALW
jgi:hypothetical protein